MPFLSVLLAYLLSRYTSVTTYVHQDAWFQRLMTEATRRSTGNLPFWLLVPGISALLGLLAGWLPFWPSFLLGLATLLYSLGRGNWRQYTCTTLEKLRENKAEQVWLALDSAGDVESRADTLWMAMRHHAAYSYLRDLFAVFFWFCLLGPAGALLYRLLDHYNTLASTSSATPQPLWQRALEWLPARYMGLCFCLAGDFTRCFWVWRELFFDTTLDTRDFLCRCLDAALVLDGTHPTLATSPEQEQIETALRYGDSLQDLLARTEVIGLVGLALVVLVFR